MSGFVLHPDAVADLDEIWEFIATDSLNAADSLLQQIYEAIRSLIPFPQAGHIRSELTGGRCAFILYETS